MEPIRRQPLFSLSSPPSWHLSESTKYMKLQSELTRVETRKETWLKRKQLSEWERTDSNCQYKLFHDGKTNERTPARLPCPPNFLPNAPQTKCHLRGQKEKPRLWFSQSLSGGHAVEKGRRDHRSPKTRKINQRFHRRFSPAFYPFAWNSKTSWHSMSNIDFT